MDEEKFILFQARGVPGDGRLRNAWFILCINKNSLQIFQIFDDIPPPEDIEWIGNDLLGINSAFVGRFLYTVGGQVASDFELSKCIRWLDINSRKWDVATLPSSCADSVIGVYDDYLYILPGEWKFGCYGVDEGTYLTTRPAYIWNTNANTCHVIDKPPPTGEGGRRQWSRIRACAALDGRGLLIAMDGEKNTNFYLHNPDAIDETNDWEIYKFGDPLPKFMGETSFAASNGRLYILEIPGTSPAFLYIYSINEGKLIMNKQPVKWLNDLWSLDLDENWDRVVRLIPLTDDKLCFLWLAPPSFENENKWPPVRSLLYLKLKFSINTNPKIETVDMGILRTNITNLLYCLPCDPKQFGAEVEGKSPLYHSDLFQEQMEDKTRSTVPADQLQKPSFHKKSEVETNSDEESVVTSQEEFTIKYDEDPVSFDLGKPNSSVNLGKRTFSLCSDTKEVPHSLNVGSRTGSINLAKSPPISTFQGAGVISLKRWIGSISFISEQVSIDFSSGPSFQCKENSISEQQVSMPLTSGPPIQSETAGPSIQSNETSISEHVSTSSTSGPLIQSETPGPSIQFKENRFPDA